MNRANRHPESKDGRIAAASPKAGRWRRGHAMLELALSAGVMIACLGGTFQFGYTFYIYNRLVTAIGNGGRYATTLPSTDGVTAIQNMVVYGDSLPSPDAAPLIPNLTTGHVEVQWIGSDAAHPASVRVTIRNYKVDALFGAFDFDGRPMAEFPYVPTSAAGINVPVPEQAPEP